jgi:peptidoglycan/LPS O-acetylase OafA/YrhL
VLLHLKRLRSLLLTGGIALCIVFLYRYLIWTSAENKVHWLMQLPGTCEGFYCGLLIAVLDRRDLLAPWRTRRFAARIIALALLLFFILIALLDANAQTYWNSWHFPSLFHPVMSLVFATLVLGCVLLPAGPSPHWWRGLCQLCGQPSYGIYLWHLVLMLWLMQVWDLRGNALLLVLLPMTIALSQLSYRYVEQPIIDFAKARQSNR